MIPPECGWSRSDSSQKQERRARNRFAHFSAREHTTAATRLSREDLPFLGGVPCGPLFRIGERGVIAAGSAIAIDLQNRRRAKFELATPSVLLRPPWDPQTWRTSVREAFAPDEADRWLAWTVNVPLLDVSATEVRRRLAAGEDVSGLLPDAVAAYIREQHLYGC